MRASLEDSTGTGLSPPTYSHVVADVEGCKGGRGLSSSMVGNDCVRIAFKFG